MSDEQGLPDCPIASQGHNWLPFQARVSGYGSIGTYVYERCTECGIIRLNPNREVYVPETDLSGKFVAYKEADQ